MRKRLRKKLRRGEFRHWAIELTYHHEASERTELLRVWDPLYALAEEHGLQMAAGGQGDQEFWLHLAGESPGRFLHVVEEMVDRLRSHGISRVQLGPWKDAWNSRYNAASGHHSGPSRRQRGWRAARRRRRAALGLPLRLGRRSRG